MRSEVTSPIYTIDHLMVGACDLELGKAWVTRKLGAMAIDGGCHAGQGTRNAIAGLAHQCYLEVIAPDPAQELKGTFGEKLLGYKAPRLRAFAVGCDSFDDLVLRLIGLEYQYSVLDMFRETRDGAHLSWRLLFLEGHAYGATMPFFIEWGQSPHPSHDLIPAGRLAQINVRLPGNLADFQCLMTMLDLPVKVSQGASGLSATIQGAQGLIKI